MEDTSACICQTKEVDLSDSSKVMDGSSCDSVYFTALSGSIVGGTERGEYCSTSSVEEQIQQLKSHWSLLAESDSSEEDEVAEVSNLKGFTYLEKHPVFSFFFRNFNEGDGSTLVVGEKFAEGGQAELFHVQVKWGNPKTNEDVLKFGYEYVLKVFKKGTYLKHLLHQLPHGLLMFRAEEVDNWNSPTPTVFPRYCCAVHYGTLLKDGRFAFLMGKENADLRSVIESNMRLRSGEDSGPFSKEDAELMMYKIARGVEWLHSRDIVHRELKASNVLIKEYGSGRYPRWYCTVADYECSIGVVGTGFFRAPEILQACKDRKLRHRPEVYSKAADVYSYGMTC